MIENEITLREFCFVFGELTRSGKNLIDVPETIFSEKDQKNIGFKNVGIFETIVQMPKDIVMLKLINLSFPSFMIIFESWLRILNDHNNNKDN